MSFRPPISFLRSLGVAVRGIRDAVAEERNLRIHLGVTALVIGLGMWADLSRIEWGLLVLCIGSVLTGELLNTAIETVVDLVCPGEHELARKAKDISAGAVLTLTVMSVVLGLLILIPPLVEKWRAFPPPSANPPTFSAGDHFPDREPVRNCSAQSFSTL